MSTSADVRLIAGTNTLYLAEEIAKCYGKPLANTEIKRFSDGEISPVINESVRGSYVFVIQSLSLIHI